jgi:hypothetical protein
MVAPECISYLISLGFFVVCFWQICPEHNNHYKYFLRENLSRIVPRYVRHKGILDDWSDILAMSDVLMIK